MNAYVFVFLIILQAVFIAAFVYLFIRYKNLKKTFNKYQRGLCGLLKTINSVRYGNLFERINNETLEVFPKLSKSVNSMIESIVDREDMIKEYQNDLNKKIDVLTEVEELKEDFVATLTHDLKVPILAEKNMLSFWGRL